MAYTNKYRLEFDTVNNHTTRIDIQEDGFAGAITYFKCAGSVLDYPDGDRSKMIGVNKSTLSFDVYCDGTFDPEIFLTNSETQYKVLLYINDTLNWVGWIDSSDTQIPFVDYQTFSLTAHDGLKLLVEAKLQNLSDVDLWGGYSLKDYICFCLDKTQLGLNFWTWIDIYPDSAPVRGAGGDTLGANDPLNQAYIYNTTFIQGVKEYDSPFIVLQKICDSFSMRLFQARGEWHLTYTEDYIRNLGITGTQWNASGTALQYLSNQRHRVNIGLREDIQMANADALVTYQKQYKSVRTNYAFDVPANLIRNIDLNESDLIASTPAAFFKGDLKYWSYTGTQPTVYVVWNAESMETERYIRVDLAASGTTRFTTTAFQVNNGDHFWFKCLYTIGSFGGSTGRLVWKVKVTGVLSDFYLKPDGKWQTGGAALTNVVSFNNAEGLTIANTDVIPNGRFMEITLGFDGVSGGSTTNIISDMKFEYGANISTRFSAQGHYYQSEQTAESKLKYEDETYINDSLNRVFTGSLIDSVGLLIPNWKHKGVAEVVRFGMLLNRAKWKSLYRNYYRIEGNILNVVNNNYLISPLNTIIQTQVENKEFNVASLRVDIANQRAEITMVELLNTSSAADFNQIAAQEKFQYINTAEKKVFVEPKPFRTPPPVEYGLIGIIVDLVQRRRDKRS